METTTTIRLFSHKSLPTAAAATGPLPNDVHMVAAVAPFPPVYLCPNLFLYIVVVIIIFNILFSIRSTFVCVHKHRMGIKWTSRVGFLPFILRSNRTRSRLTTRSMGGKTGVWYSVVRRSPRRQRVAFSPEFAHNNSHLKGGVLARKRNETYGRTNIVKSFSISKTF